MKPKLDAVNSPFNRRTLMAVIGLFGLCGCAALTATGKDSVPTYSMEDFQKVKKYDAHVHANTASTIFINQAKKDNFEILSINVDYPDFPQIDTQADIAAALRKYDSGHFHYASTFSMNGFEAQEWVNKTIARIEQSVKDGAVAVKIWKNVGMVEKTKSGELIMLDNSLFDPIIAKIISLGIPLIGHQGEPHNCWLPLDKMTNENDREYFKAHPHYHMYLHPEEPSYEDQMAVRDRFLSKHKDLPFAGAHMASLEWSVEELAKFLDSFPNADIDLAARMSEVQYQSVADYNKVRDFFIKYQDRIMYGTDLTMNADTETNMPAQNPPSSGLASFAQEAHRVWLSDWQYLATDQSQFVPQIKNDAKGLSLPKSVIDKIYYKNAKRKFHSRKTGE